MKKTPLHEQHLELGARMGEFGGWDMPIQYRGILQEHHHTRTKVSVFDICHMGEFELSGPTAQSDLERLLTCKISTLEVGQVRYGFLLNQDGKTLDDLTCYRCDQDRYMLVVNAGTTEKDSTWIRTNISESTTFADLSDSLAKLDVQGPGTRHALEDVFECTFPDLGYFRFKEFDTGDGSFLISRTGYTGEFGYELYLPTHIAVHVWQKLIAHEEIEPGGLGARDTLRLEMGYPLYGHELSEDRSPAATSRGSFIHLNKEFLGKAGVETDLENPNAYLVGLRFDSKRAAREHDKIFSGNVEVGEITSGSVAPSLGVAVAMAFVHPEVALYGQTLDVEIRGKRFPAEIVELPFYKDGTARN